MRGVRSGDRPNDARHAERAAFQSLCRVLNRLASTEIGDDRGRHNARRRIDANMRTWWQAVRAVDGASGPLQ